MELETRDAVADVPQTGRAVGDDRLAALAEIGEAQPSGESRLIDIVARGRQSLQPSLVDAIKRPVTRFLEQRRHGAAFGPQPAGKPAGAERIDHLEGALAPIVAEPHRVIDGDQMIGDIEDDIGGIAQRFRQHVPGVAMGALRPFEELTQT